MLPHPDPVPLRLRLSYPACALRPSNGSSGSRSPAGNQSSPRLLRPLFFFPLPSSGFEEAIRERAACRSFDR